MCLPRIAFWVSLEVVPVACEGTERDVVLVQELVEVGIPSEMRTGGREWGDLVKD
jgi:hypothetical protein